MCLYAQNTIFLRFHANECIHSGSFYKFIEYFSFIHDKRSTHNTYAWIATTTATKKLEDKKKTFYKTANVKYRAHIMWFGFTMFMVLWFSMPCHQSLVNPFQIWKYMKMMHKRQILRWKNPWSGILSVFDCFFQFSTTLCIILHAFQNLEYIKRWSHQLHI